MKILSHVFIQKFYGSSFSLFQDLFDGVCVHRGRAKGKESQADSSLSVEADTGLDSTRGLIS